MLKGRLLQAEKISNQSDFNAFEDNQREVGIIGSGIGYYHAKSFIEPKQFSWLKLGFVYPFPIELVKQFASKVKKLIVVEELRPYIEDNLRGLNVEVLGKNQTGLSDSGEFNPDIIRAFFAKLGYCEPAEPQVNIDLPPRPPILCPGCTHRAFYYALNSIKQYTDESSLKGKPVCKIVTGDIGCYTLGALPPLNTVQSCLCMGAGISQAAGMVHAGVKDKVFAVIGDSTFFHGGMPGLLNIAYNKANVCVLILDNRITAMTGHQPTPESGKTVMGDDTIIVNVGSIAKSLGIKSSDS